MVLAKQVSLGSNFWLGRFQGTLQPLSEESLPMDPMWFLIITKLRKKTLNTILWPVRLSMTILYCISNEEKYIRSAC